MPGRANPIEAKLTSFTFYEVEEIFNTTKQCEALDLAGDSSELESKDGEDCLRKHSANIEGYMPPSVCPDFGLGGSTDLGSIFLQGMLSGK